MSLSSPWQSDMSLSPPWQYTVYVSADGLADEIMEKLAEKTGVSARLIKLIDERKHKVYN